MQRVDFYILEGSGAGACEQFTCRLAEKAYDQGHRIFIRTADASQATMLDELLWTFRQGSFLPHAAVEAATDEPIVIGASVATADIRDLLINLGGEPPAQWQSFQRVAEVVDSAPQSLAAARQRFRLYREAGLEPHYHKLNRT